MPSSRAGEYNIYDELKTFFPFRNTCLHAQLNYINFRSDHKSMSFQVTYIRPFILL